MKTIISLILLTTIAYAYDGKVIAITDGDTIKVISSANIIHRVRLYGVDSPEKTQEFGTQSKKALSEMIFSKMVNIEIVDQDHYGREIALVFSENVCVNKEMVKKGWAWHYVQYAKNDKELAKLQKEAMEEKVGVWSGNAIPPWEYRKKVKEKP